MDTGLAGINEEKEIIGSLGLIPIFSMYEKIPCQSFKPPIERPSNATMNSKLVKRSYNIEISGAIISFCITYCNMYIDQSKSF